MKQGMPCHTYISKRINPTPYKTKQLYTSNPSQAYHGPRGTVKTYILDSGYFE